MNLFRSARALLMFSLVLPVVAFAQEVAAAPVDYNDPHNIAKLLLNAVMNKQWGIVASLGVAVIVALLRKFVPEGTAVGKWLRSKWGALITNLTLTLSSSFLTLFMAGGTFSLALVIKALTLAVGSAGAWSIWKNFTEASAEKKAQDAGTAAAAAPTDTLNK